MHKTTLPMIVAGLIIVCMGSEARGDMCETPSGECGISCPGKCNCVEITDIVINTGGGDGTQPNKGGRTQQSTAADVGCECGCTGSPISVDFLRKITEKSRLNYLAKGMPLGEIGAIFAARFPGRICVPAEKVYSPITVNYQKITLPELFKRLGLIWQSSSSEKQK